MKRRKPLRADPEKTRAWQRRSRKPLARSAPTSNGNEPSSTTDRRAGLGRKTPPRHRRAKDAADFDAAKIKVRARSGGRCEIAPLLADLWDRLDPGGPDRDRLFAAMRSCRKNASQVHHRQPRGMGGRGDNTPENLLDACERCHDWVETNRSLAIAAGALRRH